MKALPQFHRIANDLKPCMHDGDVWHFAFEKIGGEVCMNEFLVVEDGGKAKAEAKDESLAGE